MCKVGQPLSEYHRYGGRAKGLRTRCKTCSYEDTKRQRLSNPVPYRNAQLRQYGITSEEYEEMARQQGEVCFICQKPQRRARNKYLCVDHCHVTGKIRKLLCHRCNAALGYADDNPDQLRQMADYLEQH